MTARSTIALWLPWKLLKELESKKCAFTKGAQPRHKDSYAANIFKQHSNKEKAARVPGVPGMLRTLPRKKQSKWHGVLSVLLTTITVTAVKTALYIGLL